MTFISQFAATTEAEPSLFSALGIDWRLLIIQIVAFLLLVLLLRKFVYPWLMKSVDERQANIEAAEKAAVEAKKEAASGHEQVAALLAEARKEAAGIVETAKLESAELLSTSETRAKNNAERIVADAHAQIDKDIEKAQKELYNETLSLVSRATEKIVGAELTEKVDDARIAKAVKDAA